MKDSGVFFTAWQPRILSVFRVVVAFLCIEHGSMKLLGFPPSEMFKGLELFGGALLILGLFTRLTAFILSGEMAVAYFMVHAPQSFFQVLNHGEAAVFYCFVFLYFSVAGGGAWSVDKVLERRRP